MRHSLLIIAHPDDEVLWGGEALEDGSHWHILCLTNSKNLIRQKKFVKICKLFNATYEMYDHKEQANASFSDEVLLSVQKIIKSVVDIRPFDKILTHNPDGEYGHISHKQISSIVTQLCFKKGNLYYFDIDPSKEPFMSKNKLKAFKIYFKSFSINKVASVAYNLKIEKNNIFKKILKKIKQLVIKILNYFVCKLDSLPLSDYGHITTSCYETHTLASEYVSKTSQVSVFYNHNFNPKSATDLYLRFKHIYDRYRDRKYLITEFLPKCLGLTLSVGCHHYNRFDCYCLPNPKNTKLSILINLMKFLEVHLATPLLIF